MNTQNVMSPATVDGDLPETLRAKHTEIAGKLAKCRADLEGAEKKRLLMRQSMIQNFDAKQMEETRHLTMRIHAILEEEFTVRSELGEWITQYVDALGTLDAPARQKRAAAAERVAAAMEAMGYCLAESRKMLGENYAAASRIIVVNEKRDAMRNEKGEIVAAANPGYSYTHQDRTETTIDRVIATHPEVAALDRRLAQIEAQWRTLANPSDATLPTHPRTINTSRQRDIVETLEEGRQKHAQLVEML